MLLFSGSSVDKTGKGNSYSDFSENNNKMAVPPKWIYTKRDFSFDFEVCKVAKRFTGKVTNKYQIAITEVLGSRPDLQVDLNFQFDGCDKETRDLAAQEKKDLQANYKLLEKQWDKNAKNKLPRWAGFADDDVFLSSNKYKTLLQPLQVPTTETNRGDSRFVENYIH